jgi:uncharacterized membrane protein YphA (DoxX/SURF4 family)
MIWLKRLRLLLAWGVSVWLALKFIPNGWDKFDPAGFWSEPFARWGYPVWLRWLVGALEVGGGTAILLPWLATYGGIALAVVMAGAFYTRFGAGFPDDLFWIAVYARVESPVAAGDLTNP